jgi:kynureninase
MINPDELYKSPNALAQYYSNFRVAERLHLTGHSHQAWPDCGFDGQKQAWLDAAEYADEKWERSFAKAELVRKGFSRLLDDKDGHIALGQNTHELVTRFLSALPLRNRPRLVTTDGEFHTIRRQLDRLAEEDVDMVKIKASPAASLAERLAEAVDDRTSAVMVSSVLFQNAQIVPGLGYVLDACRKVGAELLVDAYHALNVVSISLKQDRLEGAFIVGGGYKYCQLGEGNCFLRFPEGCKMRPVITGWFSEFSALTETSEQVVYGQGPDRFAGATYDPTSHYRAAEVFNFFNEHELTPKFLRQISRHQVGLLARLFDELDADTQLISRDRSVKLEDIGGFLALYSLRASDICRLLRERRVLTDYRGEILRLGPAPYMSDQQLTEAMEIFGKVVRSLEAKE